MYPTQHTLDTGENTMLRYTLTIGTFIVSLVTFASTPFAQLMPQKQYVTKQLYPVLTAQYKRKVTPKQKQNVTLQSPVLGAMLTAHLDGDGLPEIITSESETGIHVYSKTMDWSFSARVGRAIPTIGDLDGDDKVELLIASCDAEQGKRKCYLHVLSTSGKEVRRTEIPGEIRGAIILADLDGDKQNEVIFTTQNSKLVVLERDGDMRKGFPKDLGPTLPITESIYVPSPAVGELDGRASNGREIVAISNKGAIHVFHANGDSLPAFPHQLKEPVFASPSLGDFDGDGQGELVVATAKGKIFLFTPNAQIKEGFPQMVRGQVIATPTWADLNRDGKLDLFVGTQKGFVYGINTQGKHLPGWPRKVDGAVTASPVAADITTDAHKELVVVTQAGSVYVFQKWGITTIGYPVHSKQLVYATPAVTDLDNNGRADILFATHNKQLKIFEDLRLGDPKRFGGGVTFRGSAQQSGSLANVYKPAQLQPTSNATPTPKQTTPVENTKTGTDPTQQTPNTSLGCSTQTDHTPTPYSLLWLGFLLVGLLRPSRPRS
ncbi:MAG TPA: hypothetical protein DCE42_27160 [Myxococcales bacterium]|nr:hypothetical protein [Deltaproteobacteria bacterium]HAA58472.1 hypothetical protein [Myxococcales bacterium]|tara:strand:- start:2833 stop:4476 length:1644 start_codon:yes stop_codon:yes gene_type:complete